MSAERMGSTPRDRRRRAMSAFWLAMTGVAALLTVIPLLLIFFHLLRAGLGSMNLAFFTSVPAPVGQPGGGVGNGVLGTALLVGLAALMGLPVAIGAGIFLAEAEGGRLANGIRFVTDVMNGIPSIVIGIFVWAWVVVAMGGFTAFAGGVALALMLIPMVTRTTEEMVRLVPKELKEGALALGFTRWRTTLGVVLPAARSGILTGVLVALARIAGETAPLLFTAFGNPFWSARLDQPIAALPVQIFQYAISPFEDQHRQAWAASLLLIGLVLAMNLVARFLIRSPFRSR
ncbi:phosphate transport system permease protein [Longimicrobium terrae]|uniref:Phosphate transport system permease protein PstA n=2 Tax=Longimicrobium terrae TaxID=1639882 RepID=A0A841H788_9BACT|nr:phosphate transport system permease protein [Longimicrobium terrae]MBB6073716.1 phosphate transport system permease protein [Longimicrobium terrae]